MEIFTQRLSAEQLALLPTEEDVAFHEEHSWYISKKLLFDEIIDEAIRGSERYYRGERDTPLLVSSGYRDWKPEHGNIVRNNEFVSLQNRQLRQLALQPIIGAIAARLTRTKRIRLFEDQGDMSLVSPRPLMVEYLDRYSFAQARRHEVKPGITGWVQVNGRNTLS